MSLDRKQAREAFKRFLSAYDLSDRKILLKARHTYRVAFLSERIALGLKLPADEVDLAWLCGLLHDLGRFEQVRRFHSFIDADTVNHAHLSVELLFASEGECGESPIRDFTADEANDHIIRCAIAHHSDYALPEDLDERALMFCRILRDADKIDILRVNAVEPCESIYPFSENEMRESRVSKTALQGFYEHRTLMRSERTFPADYVIGHICFVYGLVFPESLSLIARQGHLMRMLNRPFEDEGTALAFEQMRAHLHGWFFDQGARLEP